MTPFENAKEMKKKELEGLRDFIWSPRFFNILQNNLCGKTFKVDKLVIITAKSPSKSLIDHDGNYFFNNPNGKRIFKCKFELITTSNFMSGELNQSTYYYLYIWLVSDNYVCISIIESVTGYLLGKFNCIEMSDFMRLLKNPFEIL